MAEHSKTHPTFVKQDTPDATAELTPEQAKMLRDRRLPDETLVTLSTYCRAHGPTRIKASLGSRRGKAPALIFAMPGPSVPGELQSGEQVSKWSDIPFAAGCTAACENLALSAHDALSSAEVMVLTTQQPGEQQEIIWELVDDRRIQLLSDPLGEFAKDLGLPVFRFGGKLHCGRGAFLVHNGKILKAFPSIVSVRQVCPVICDIVKGKTRIKYERVG